MTRSKRQIGELIEFAKHHEQYDGTVPEDRPEIARRIAVSIVTYTGISNLRSVYGLPPSSEMTTKADMHDWYIKLIENKIGEEE
jgi:hypothetical protein